VHDFDQDSFNQLLAEASGSDDQGQPNLGRDVVVNHKLICIVFQIGIESTLEENPFRAATAARKGKSQLRTCLEVLRVAIERSQQVVFVKSDRQGIGAAAKACSLYSWLIPTLLPLVASEQTDEISDAVLALYDAILDADKNCTPHSSSDVVLSFLRHSVSSEFSAMPYLQPTPNRARYSICCRIASSNSAN
jgi:serine/threonine-protein kinase ATR